MKEILLALAIVAGTYILYILAQVAFILWIVWSIDEPDKSEDN